MIRLLTIALALALVLGGALVRLSARNQTFFGDEMWVLEYVESGRYVPNAVPQPPLFFYSAVAASRLCGTGEACLRAPAEIAAVLLSLIPLLVWRTTRVLRPAGVIVWTTILAFSSPVSFYAARVKQYPLEALGCAVVLWLFIRAAEERGRWKTFAIVAAVLVASLHSPVFILAATGVAALVFAETRAERLKLLGMHVALAAAFGIAYFAYMRPGPEVARYFGNLEEYFTADLPAFWDGSPAFVVSHTRLWLAQMLNLTRGLAATVGVAVLAWLWSIAQRRERLEAVMAIVTLAPAGIVLAASAVHLYPYGEVRLMIFLLPGVSFAFALAVQWLLGQRRFIAVPATAGVAILLTMFIVQGTRDDPYNASYMRIDDLRRGYDHLKLHHRTGTPIVVRAFDVRPLRHYVPIDSRDVIAVPPGAAAVAVPPGVPEFWTLLRSHDAFRVSSAESRPVEEVRVGGTHLVRYRLGVSSTP